eukprot:CAMPEP_0185790286 /NCGR_PEP_ID=MMETSP1174-20130828/155371_1 /TAXON_ID=35687 /ORGANISM="Dictyocha speculum, Strain CCMP1381" /LENGTH=68 /DNA_ID=CAMNT_0028484887 /DNA_START=621 /DNA_END=823 /DNA_ORIENTATION=+
MVGASFVDIVVGIMVSSGDGEVVPRCFFVGVVGVTLGLNAVGIMDGSDDLFVVPAAVGIIVGASIRLG